MEYVFTATETRTPSEMKQTKKLYCICLMLQKME